MNESQQQTLREVTIHYVEVTGSPASSNASGYYVNEKHSGSDSWWKDGATTLLDLTFDDFINPFLIFFSGVCSLVTFLGNLVVIVSFLTDKKLHRTSNYYIISLAVADMFVGIFSIPLFGMYLVLGMWPLGHIACNLWLMMDYALCFTSLLMIFIICIDRYWSVSSSVHYRNHFNLQVALLMIAPAWIFPMLVFFILVWCWSFIKPDSEPVPSGQCYVPYSDEPLATTILAVGSFWIPLILIMILYSQVFIVAKRLSTKTSNPHNLSAKSKEGCQHLLKPNQSFNPTVHKLSTSTQNGTNPIMENDIAEKDATENCQKTNNLPKGLSNINKEDQNENQRLASSQPPQSGKIHQAPAILKVSSIRRNTQGHNAVKNKHFKALKMLSVILSCYIFCWAPFSLFVIIKSYCADCVPDKLWNLSYWLCYVNSTVNPFCYAYANNHFQKVAIRLAWKTIRNITCGIYGNR